MRFLPAIIIAIAIILAPVIWLVGSSMMSEGVGGDGPAIDSGARIELLTITQQIDTLQRQVQVLEQNLESVAADVRQIPNTTAQPQSGGELFDDGTNDIQDFYAKVVEIAGRRNVNAGLTIASPKFLEELLGRPRETLSDKCQSMTNEKLKSMLVLENVGPIRVRMLQPAVDSLKRVFEAIRNTDQDLYDRISTAGSLCVRRIRGTQDRLSTHSFGLSLDLNIDGKLDTLGDGNTQMGLTILADFFLAEGWFWGAGFSREDSMHFEVSRGELERWRREGLI